MLKIEHKFVLKMHEIQNESQIMLKIEHKFVLKMHEIQNESLKLSIKSTSH
jgi:hypothetical protein